MRIALVDWNWMGHHPMYFRNLMDGFLTIGCEVAAFCPDIAVEEVTQMASGKEGVTVQSCRYVHPRMRLPEFIRNREHSHRLFGGLQQKLLRWEKREGKKISLVFFQTIYDAQFENIQYAKRCFSFPWSGIYLHARAFRLPGTTAPGFNRLPCPGLVTNHPSLRSMCLLDEGVVSKMQNLLEGKPVFSFPDITDELIEDEHTDQTLAARLLRFANGRKIVVSLGHLQKTKGILELCHVARDPRNKEICFFFGGEVNWHGMSDEESSFIRLTWEQSPNVLTHLTRIVSDATMNAVIKASDVVFAAYTNFPNSSNIMTKAAMLERPVIVSDGHLMAERVRQHKLGEIVPEGSVESIIRAIGHLCDQRSDPEADYRGYYTKHSPEALQTALTKVIAAIPSR